LASRCRAKDSTYGEGTFIYLKGASNTVVGSLVTYNSTTGATVLTTTSGVVNGGAPIAVAMSANNTTDNYGWYQVVGAAVVKKTAVKVDPAGTTKVYLSATAGRAMQTSVSGRQVLGRFHRGCHRWASQVPFHGVDGASGAAVRKACRRSSRTRLHHHGPWRRAAADCGPNDGGSARVSLACPCG